MKQALLLSFILSYCFALTLDAQVREIPPKPTDETYEYIPFATGDAVWTNRARHSFPNQRCNSEGVHREQEMIPATNFFSNIYMKGDTLWHGKLYRKLYLSKYAECDYSPESFWGAIREEDKRIYVRLSETYQGKPHVIPVFGNMVHLVNEPPKYDEFIYYDFNIQEDPESFYKDFFDQHFAGFGSSVEYKGFDYEWIGERWRKVFYFDAPLNGFRWIEGIGSSRGFGYNGTLVTTSNQNFYELNLLCYFEDGKELYHAKDFEYPLLNPDACFQIDEVMNVENTLGEAADLISNEDGVLYWTGAELKQIRIYDMQARQLVAADLKDKKSLPLPKMPSGIYVYVAETPSGKRLTGKLQL